MVMKVYKDGVPWKSKCPLKRPSPGIMRTSCVAYHAERLWTSSLVFLQCTVLRKCLPYLLNHVSVGCKVDPGCFASMRKRGCVSIRNKGGVEIECKALTQTRIGLRRQASAVNLPIINAVAEMPQAQSSQTGRAAKSQHRLHSSAVSAWRECY